MTCGKVYLGSRHGQSGKAEALHGRCHAWGLTNLADEAAQCAQRFEESGGVKGKLVNQGIPLLTQHRWVVGSIQIG